MPRNIKCRRICAEPQNTVLFPQNSDKPFIKLTVDELESLRLCDLENLEQDIAAENMNISRGTLQRILYSARKHTAEALTNGYGIIIEGGHYIIAENHCNCMNKCRKCEFKNNEKKEQ